MINLFSRYLTLLYFLNDVEEGGETAFPIADNETYDEDVSYSGIHVPSVNLFCALTPWLLICHRIENKQEGHSSRKL